MAIDTTIGWCRRRRRNGTLMPGHTFNPWWGCVEVSPACDDCYARAWAERWGLELWGKEAPRRFFGDHHWNDPLRWNRAAAALGEQHLVFCGSMMDVFEKRDNLNAHRERLWRLIASTPWLVWLLLAKRKPIVPWTGRWPDNVWLGVTVESPEYLWRLDAALEHDAPVHFVSHEPSVADVDFVPYLGDRRGRVQWLIMGTENTAGERARVLPLDRARRLVKAAHRAGAKAFVKQLDASLINLGRKGLPIKALEMLPPGLQVQEWPEPLPVVAPGGSCLGSDTTHHRRYDAEEGSVGGEGH